MISKKKKRTFLSFSISERKSLSKKKIKKDAFLIALSFFEKIKKNITFLFQTKSSLELFLFSL